jgi:hypothetical protein
MIQLANDPNASRMGWRPAQSESKVRKLEHPCSRGGHAWPFLSRQSGRTAPPTASRTTSSDSVS